MLVKSNFTNFLEESAYRTGNDIDTRLLFCILNEVERNIVL